MRLLTTNRIRFVASVVEVVSLAIWIEIALRRRPFDRVLARLAQSRRHAASASEISHATFERAIRVVYRVLPLEPTCLKHALIFFRVRRRRGLPAHLRIGVRKDDGVFAAHAWLEDEDGRALTDPSKEFVPLLLASRERTRGV